MMSIKKSSTNW